MSKALAWGLVPAVAVGAVGVAWLAHKRRNRLEIVDLRAHAPSSKRGKRTREVDSVVLHQMGFSRGSDLMRYVGVTAHFVVAPDGGVAQLHPMSARLSSSHGFNGRSVAIEFAGNLRSANGKWWSPETHGRNTLMAPQVDSGRRLLRMLRGAGVRFVFAHRQSSEDRGNDPGPEVWSSVGQWALERLEMSDGGERYALDGGKSVPASWRSRQSTSM